MTHFVAYAIIATIVLTMVNAIVVEPVDYLLADGFYTLLGFGYMVFGIWAAILLLKTGDKRGR